MWDGCVYRGVSSFPKLFCERVLCLGFPVNQVDVWRRSAPVLARTIVADGVEPLPQLVTVAVRAVTGKHFDACTKGDLVAENAKQRCLLDDSATQRVLGLEADDQDCVPRIGRAMREVVQNATRLGHSRRCDDDHRSMLRVERL